MSLSYAPYRDYGRFGSFFETELKAGESLALAYRIHVKAGAMPSREEMAERYAAFTHPLKVRVVQLPAEE